MVAKRVGEITVEHVQQNIITFLWQLKGSKH